MFFIIWKIKKLLFHCGSQKNIASTGWREILHNKKLTMKEDTTFVRFDGPVIKDISFTIKPYEIVIVEAP